MDPISPRPDPSDAGGAIPLSGGNVTSAVVRIGNTVRRPAGPSTPAVHAADASPLGGIHRGSPTARHRRAGAPGAELRARGGGVAGPLRPAGGRRCAPPDG